MLKRVLLTNRPHEYLDRVLLHPPDIDIIHIMNETYFTSSMYYWGKPDNMHSPQPLFEKTPV